jgi:hypothetical protein
MKRFDLYGSANLSLRDTADELAAVLGVVFEAHDSGYLGGDYYRAANEEGAEILVQGNPEDDEGDRPEPDFADVHTLVYVNKSTAALASGIAQIPNLALLRSELV